jgi:large subunit ribosomal protein L6
MPGGLRGAPDEENAMSRIGYRPIPLPSGVEVSLRERRVSVKGPKGTLEWEHPASVSVTEEDGQLKVARDSDSRQNRAYHGLTRSLLNNMVTGVSQGFRKSLQIIGIGYRAEMKGRAVVLHVGLSHAVEFEPPEQVQITLGEGNTVNVEGIDRQAVGQVAADIRALRPPERYKGKGIRYVDEVVRRKAGKSAVGGAT